MEGDSKKYERRKRVKIDHELTAQRFCEKNIDPDWLCKHYIDEDIGFGVFANREIEKGEFIVEYAGELIKKEEGIERLATYGENRGSFIFFYNKICIDATFVERIGKYVNDSTNPNGKVIGKVFNGKQRLCIFALTTIEKGTEIRYSYGTNAENFWWRKKEYLNKHPFSRAPLQLADLKNQPILESSQTSSEVKKMKRKPLTEGNEGIDKERSENDVLAIKKTRKKDKRKVDSKDNLKKDKPEEFNKKLSRSDASYIELEIDESNDATYSKACPLETENIYSHANLDLRNANLQKNTSVDPDAIAKQNRNKTDFKIEYQVKSSGHTDSIEIVDDNSPLEVSTTNDPKNDSGVGGDFPQIIDTSDEENMVTERISQPEQTLRSSFDYAAGPSDISAKKSTQASTTKNSNANIDDMEENMLTERVSLPEDTPRKSVNCVAGPSTSSAKKSTQTSITKHSKIDDMEANMFTERVSLPEHTLRNTVNCVAGPSTSSAKKSSEISTIKNSNVNDIATKVRKRPLRTKLIIPNYFQGNASSGPSDMSDSDTSYHRNSSDNESESEYSSESSDIPLKKNCKKKLSDIPSNKNSKKKICQKSFIPAKREKEDSVEGNKNQSRKLNHQLKDHNKENKIDPECLPENLKIYVGKVEGNSMGNDSEESHEVNKDENNSITVMLSKHSKGKRSWEKQFPCLLCPKHYHKIPRHLEDIHHENIEVAHAMSLKPTKNDSKEEALEKSKERNKIFEKLQKKGCFQHNIQVLQEGKGILVPEKCPSKPKSYKDYLFCQHCYGLYFRLDLARHVNDCKFVPKDFISNPRGHSIQGLASMMIPSKAVPNEDLKNIISRMLVDDKSFCLRNDPLIIKYGNIMCRKHMNNGDQSSHISNKLRELARFLIEMRKLNSTVNQLEDAINPALFNDVVKATVTMCGWNTELNQIETPSLGPKLGMSLKKIAHVLKGEAMINGEESKIVTASRFEELIIMRWNDEISKCSRIELERRKWNKPKLLPFTSDLQILRDHLKQITASSLNELAKNNEDQKAWRNLALATLSWLILFNRRRGGEAAALTVQDFNNHKKVETNEEILKSLTEFEIKLCKTFTCIEIRGKRSRKVPLMFSKEVHKIITLLIKLRENVGVAKKNPFVFAVCNGGSEREIRGCDALKKHVDMCELKHPEAICSINLRKHVATLSQLLNLEERELENLANYLGHDIRIHREFYRLPENVLMVAKCGKILVAMEEGIGNYAGKKLEDIDVSLAEVEEDSSSVNEVANGAHTSETQEESAKNNVEPTENLWESSGGSDTENIEKKPSKKAVRRTWQKEEKEAVQQHWKTFIQSGKAPRQGDIEPFLEKEKRLAKRSWRDVKSYIHNIHTAQKRKAGIIKKK